MQLFNTLSQRVETLNRLGDEVTLYVCGVTPYDTTHLGHAFVNVVYDTLVRYLRWRGQPVRYVQNVTDIDDDILRKARELGTTWDALGDKEIELYLADLRALNVEPPTFYVRASETVPTMIELIERLLRQGLAYERDGWVYFRVAHDPGFGKLAEAAGIVGYDAMLAVANERGNNPDDPHKQDPLDFVLWQGRQPGEPAWDSPWGPGRPGWHIECSSMSVKYLGPRIDIHGGGSDLIFPHHTCEIAQSENATGERPFVQIWMHNSMVCYQGEKMSKSLGNLVRVSELLRRYDSDAIRLVLLAHHHRDQWEYVDSEIEDGVARLRRLRTAVSLDGTANHACAAMEVASDVLPGSGASPDADVGAASEQLAIIQTTREDFIAALDNDLNTPRALDVLERLAASAEASGSAVQIATLRELAGVLGLRLGSTTQKNTAVEAQATEA
ncbi:MAG TPA: cysteine--tRNA ligase [Ktedonobacterales bacterium]|jgi:L-cysteine:1D-myo-inositol 2-amino-2-deoxy-alpha-D-glucopyranoside ligase|nr:cysteine--tRNA ligase [Ktedonobacterales bacterium]